MPFYYGINGQTDEGQRTTEGLLRLKNAIKKAPDTSTPGQKISGIPPRILDHSLMLATWNIREFESGKYGLRKPEPIHYIAEIINRFDLVAVQEVRDDLSSLNKLMGHLGGWWKYLLSDVTEGIGGNRERMAFLYDSRVINFGGFTCEVVLPPVKKNGKIYEPARQLVRTPFMVGFRAGWFKFTICTAHIYYGEAVADEPTRLEEIRILAQTLAARASEPSAWAKNMILLGDFNIFDTSNKTFKAITDAGFVVPKPLQKKPSNALQTKHYDQIAFLAPDIKDQLDLSGAGVFNFFEHVYRLEDEKAYADDMGKAYGEDNAGKARDAKGKTRYYKDWRTFQMSDHLPMWIELGIDFSENYLNWKLKEKAKPETSSSEALPITPTG